MGSAGNELLDYLEQHEPLSTPLVAPLLGSAGAGDVRGELLVSEDGTAGGALVLERTTGTRTTAFAFLTDARLSEPLGRLIDASGAVTLQAPASTTDATAPHLTRLARDPVRIWFYAVEYQPELPAMMESASPEPGMEVPQMKGVGFAGAGNVDELAGLFAGYEARAPATAAELREWVARCVGTGWVTVVRRDGRIVGALTAPWRSSRYRRVDDLTVMPEYRGQRLGFEMQIWTTLRATEDGTGICGMRGLTNGQRITHEQNLRVEGPALGAHVWTLAPLRPLGRSAGRVRRRVARLLGNAPVPTRAAHLPVSWQGPDREPTAQ